MYKEIIEEFRKWGLDFFCCFFRALEDKVRELMKEKQDYKAWYYIPVPKEGREQKEQFNKDFGGQGYSSKFSASK